MLKRNYNVLQNYLAPAHRLQVKPLLTTQPKGIKAFHFIFSPSTRGKRGTRRYFKDENHGSKHKITNTKNFLNSQHTFPGFHCSCFLSVDDFPDFRDRICSSSSTFSYYCHHCWRSSPGKASGHRWPQRWVNWQPQNWSNFFSRNYSLFT